jgi:hypothetical protein
MGQGASPVLPLQETRSVQALRVFLRLSGWQSVAFLLKHGDGPGPVFSLGQADGGSIFWLLFDEERAKKAAGQGFGVGLHDR